MTATEKKMPHAGPGPLNGLGTWIDHRLPIFRLWREHASEYYVPKNLNFWYNFGSLASVVLVIQLLTGIFLVMHYKPDATQAFASVEYIMRDVPWGWLIRYMHSTGASAFFIVVYLHMFRGLLYGSFRSPRELIWILGMATYVMLMAEAFFGYLLPWGQTSYWGAQVMANLFDALPLIGPELAVWIRGDYVASDATLSRFFSFHVIAIPLVLLGLVAAHIMALHAVGSNNPDGVEIKRKLGGDGHPLDGIPFHPYYTVKDAVGVVAFLAIFAVVLFFMPDFGGYFLERSNFVPADPLNTPANIVPAWYFTPYYSILRATTADFMLVLSAGVLAMALLVVRTSARRRTRSLAVVVATALVAGFYFMEAKAWGVTLMALAVLILLLLPWLDASPARSIRYKGPLYKIALTLFVIVFLVLGYLGTQPVTRGGTYVAQLCTVLYFAFYLLMPWYSRMDQAKPVPDRLTA